MTRGRYKTGDRVKFTSHGAEFGSVGTVLNVRKDGHLIVHFDKHPEGSAMFVDLTDVSPKQAGGSTANADATKKKSKAQIRREIADALSEWDKISGVVIPGDVVIVTRASDAVPVDPGTAARVVWVSGGKMDLDVPRFGTRLAGIPIGQPGLRRATSAERARFREIRRQRP